MTTIADLHCYATRCRELARAFSDRSAAAKLQRLADDYMELANGGLMRPDVAEMHQRAGATGTRAQTTKPSAAARGH